MAENGMKGKNVRKNDKMKREVKKKKKKKRYNKKKAREVIG